MKWIPETLHWENFISIWERVPLLAYFKNTGILAVIVTFMQILTSSFAAYAFAKMSFKGRDILFMCYIGTIAVPWQVYMVPPVHHDARTGTLRHHLGAGRATELLGLRRVPDASVLSGHSQRA